MSVAISKKDKKGNIDLVLKTAHSLALEALQLGACSGPRLDGLGWLTRRPAGAPLMNRADGRATAHIAFPTHGIYCERSAVVPVVIFICWARAIGTREIARTRKFAFADCPSDLVVRLALWGPIEIHGSRSSLQRLDGLWLWYGLYAQNVPRHVGAHLLASNLSVGSAFDRGAPFRRHLSFARSPCTQERGRDLQRFCKSGLRAALKRKEFGQLHALIVSASLIVVNSDMRISFLARC